MHVDHSRRTRIFAVLAALLGTCTVVVLGYMLWSFQRSGPSDAEQYLVSHGGVSTADCERSEEGGQYFCKFTIVNTRGRTTCSGGGFVLDDWTEFPWLTTNPVERCAEAARPG